MKKFSKFVFFVLFLVVIGSVVFLTTWEIPAPTHTIERDLPDGRFPRSGDCREIKRAPAF